MQTTTGTVHAKQGLSTSQTTSNFTTMGENYATCYTYQPEPYHFFKSSDITSIVIALIVGIVIITVAHLIFKGFVINTKLELASSKDESENEDAAD